VWTEPADYLRRATGHLADSDTESSQTGRSVTAAVRPSPYWLLVKRGRGRLEVLTTSLTDGRRVLPVFSFEEEANLYVRLGIRGS
jgi:hypothetical protein